MKTHSQSGQIPGQGAPTPASSTSVPGSGQGAPTPASSTPVPGSGQSAPTPASGKSGQNVIKGNEATEKASQEKAKSKAGEQKNPAAISDFAIHLFHKIGELIKSLKDLKNDLSEQIDLMIKNADPKNPNFGIMKTVAKNIVTELEPNNSGNPQVSTVINMAKQIPTAINQASTAQAKRATVSQPLPLPSPINHSSIKSAGNSG